MQLATALKKKNHTNQTNKNAGRIKPMQSATEPLKLFKTNKTKNIDLYSSDLYQLQPTRL